MVVRAWRAALPSGLFTEGFDTLDLKKAKTLLAGLRD
jgi:hypothetical protein